MEGPGSPMGGLAALMPVAERRKPKDGGGEPSGGEGWGGLAHLSRLAAVISAGVRPAECTRSGRGVKLHLPTALARQSEGGE